MVDRVSGAPTEDEAYEDANPLHGDRLFHAFLTRLRWHPTQILRYLYLSDQPRKVKTIILLQYRRVFSP